MSTGTSTDRGTTRRAGSGPRRPGVRRVFAVLGVLLLTVAATLVLTAGVWGSELRAESRMLPGTTVAEVDVGGSTVEEARRRAGAAVDAALEREVTLTHGDRTWTVSAGALGATSDLDEAVATALSVTAEADLPELVRARWLTHEPPALAVDVTVPPDAVAGFVTGLAQDLDVEAVDATLAWTNGGPEVTEAVVGRRVERDAAIRGLTRALHDEAVDGVEVPTRSLAPSVTTATARSAARIAGDAVEAALDRPVTVTHGEHRWEVTPRELDARPVVEPVLRAAMASAGGSATDTDAGPAPPVELEVPEERIDGLVADMGAELDLAPVHATASYGDGAVRISEGRNGRALDRVDAREELLHVLRGGRGGDDAEGDAAEVELTVTEVEARSAAAFGQVLVVLQGQRRVELHRGGGVVRSWPVAVGTGGSPTPTGTFTIGAKRFEPTWVNPAPDRWGEDLPARVGPGPDNPLGLRALNWNRPGGGDTLIRFHGTPNEASIGSAASNGCVRMFNRDVIELYDLVDTGTTILSVA